MRDLRVLAGVLFVSLLLAASPVAGDVLSIDDDPDFFDPLAAPLVFSDEIIFRPVLDALSAGDLDLAARRLQSVRALHPDHPGTHELTGTIALARGDGDLAIESLSRAAALAGNEPTILAKLGLAHARSGDAAAAHEALERAIAIAPDHELARRVLGRLAVAAGDIDAAIDHYSKGLGEGLSTTHRDLAELLLAQGRSQELRALLEPLAGLQEADRELLLLRAAMIDADPAAARAALDRARRAGAEKRDLMLFAGVIDRMEGKYDESAKVLRGLHETYPDLPLLTYELAISEAARGNVVVSADLAERAADALPGDHRLRAQIAELLLGVDQPERAVSVVRSYAVTPPTPDTMVHAVRVVFRAGDIDEALRLSARLLAVAPEFIPGYQLAAQLLRRDGQDAEAREQVAAATERWPELVDLWVNRVGLLLLQGELDLAERTLTEAERHHPANPLLEFQRATIAELRGNAADAERRYTALLGTAGVRLPSLLNLALLIGNDNSRLEEAMGHAREAQKLAPDAPTVQSTVGWLRHLAGETEGAVQALESAYATAPGDPNVTCRLAIVYAETGRSEVANSLLESCLSLAPSPALAAQAKARLRTGN